MGIRAGSTPGTHLLTWDGPGESVELRLTARDRQAYADGALAACRWLVREDRGPGLHPFDAVVDELLGTAPVRATAMASAWPLPTPDPDPRHPAPQEPTMTRLTRTPADTRPRLRGALTALVTPFTPDGSLDEAAYRRLVRVAGHGRHRRARPGRHHRRVPDAHPRTSATGASRSP